VLALRLAANASVTVSVPVCAVDVYWFVQFVTENLQLTGECSDICVEAFRYRCAVIAPELIDIEILRKLHCNLFVV
jgi:hypothetical protein